MQQDEGNRGIATLVQAVGSGELEAAARKVINTIIHTIWYYVLYCIVEISDIKKKFRCWY